MDNDFSRQNERAFSSAQRDYETPPETDDGPTAADVLAIAREAAQARRAASLDSGVATRQARKHLAALFSFLDRPGPEMVEVLKYSDQITAQADAAALAARTAVSAATHALAATEAAVAAMQLDQALGDSPTAEAEADAYEKIVALYDDAIDLRDAANLDASTVENFRKIVTAIAKELNSVEVRFGMAEAEATPWDVIPRGEYTIAGIMERGHRIADATVRADMAATRATAALAPFVAGRADQVSEAVDAAAASIEALRSTRIAGEAYLLAITRAKAAEIEKDGDEFLKAFAQAEGLVDEADRAVADAIAAADLTEKLVAELKQ
jgi:hypothetical protein